MSTTSEVKRAIAIKKLEAEIATLQVRELEKKLQRLETPSFTKPAPKPAPTPKPEIDLVAARKTLSAGFRDGRKCPYPDTVADMVIYAYTHGCPDIARKIMVYNSFQVPEKYVDIKTFHTKLSGYRYPSTPLIAGDPANDRVWRCIARGDILEGLIEARTPVKSRGDVHTQILYIPLYRDENTIRRCIIPYINSQNRK